MSNGRASPVALAIGLAALRGVGIWLLLGTPGSLVNEEPAALGRTGSSQDEIVIVDVLEGESAGEIGSVAGWHYSFMGATDPARMVESGHEVGRLLREDGVPAALLVPV